MAFQQRQQPGQAPPPEDISDSTIDEMYPPRFLKPVLDFNEQPVIVQVRSVWKEWVWLRHTGRYEQVNVMYFEDYQRGLKLTKEQVKDAAKLFNSPNIRDWIGKKLKLIHVHENIAGTRYYLTRISPERVNQDAVLPVKKNAIPPTPITGEQLEELEAFGEQLYKDEWGEKAVELARAVSKPNVVSDITELTREQAQRLINGIISKITEEADDDDVPIIVNDVSERIESNRNTPDDDDEKPPHLELEEEDHPPHLELDEEDEEFQEVHNGAEQ